MGLFDGLLGGGAGSADDPYADILTPAQRNQMQVQGLLAMAGAFAQAGMPSRLPVPFGSALGSAAAALGTGQEAGMKTAIENALAAQKVRDLRNMAEYRKKVLGDIDPTSPLGRAIDAINNPGGTAPAAPPAGATPSAGTYAGGGAGTSATPGAAAAPLTMELPYAPGGGGGLLGPGDVGAVGEYGAGQPATGLLGPAPPVQRAALPSAPQQSASAPGGGIIVDGVRYPDARAWRLAVDAREQADPSGSRFNLPTERGGSSTAPAEPDPGAGGDTPWGPTFAQTAASRTGPARGETPQMTQLIERAAAERGISPDVLRGLIKTESGFKPNIVSPAGAVGLAQLMPGTARQLGVTDPTDPTQAIPAAAQYLRQGLDAGGGDINKALMYYHGGPNQAMWGPKTQAYPGAVLAAAGGAPPSASGGGGEDAGWGPTFAQGGPDRVIPSGAGGNPPAATLAQYAPGAGGAPMPGAAPGAAPVPGATGGPPLYPSAAPAGGQAAGVSQLIVELARRNAAAEVLGLGNPYGSLLTVLQGSPQYKAQVEAATEQAKRTAGLPFIKEEKRLGAEGELPSLITRDVNKGVIDQLNKQIEQMGAAALNPAGTILVNGPNGPVEKPVTQLQSAQARAGFDVPEIGFKGMRGPLPAGQIPGLPGVALPGAPGGPSATGAPGPGPQAQGVTPGGPGTLYDKPYQSPSDIKSSELGVTAGWKALQDTHAAEIAANRSDQQLGQIAEAMRGFTPGKTAEWRLTWGQYLKDAGFKIDGVSDGEIMQQAQRRLQLAAANVHEGSVSNFERGIYGETVTQLTNTPEGIVKAIGIQQRLNDYDRKVAQIHRDTIVNGVPNLVDAQSRIAKLGPPLSPGELSALQEIRAGQVPGKGQAATAPAPPDQHPLMRQQAADAIAKGAPRAGVIKRLQDMGVNTEGL